jgi:hypothetical protein
MWPVWCATVSDSLSLISLRRATCASSAVTRA